jgi:Fur family peroxide stress response transcriptional regulator
MHDHDTQMLLTEKLGENGLRATRQRELIYGIITDQPDHPTADEVFARAKRDMPSISLATVYNCLDTLVQCNLVKQVNFERQSTRYCPNLHEHAHFHDEATGRVYDVDLDARTLAQLKAILPAGYEANSVHITFRGRAPAPTRKSARATA